MTPITTREVALRDGAAPESEPIHWGDRLMEALAAGEVADEHVLETAEAAAACYWEQRRAAYDFEIRFPDWVEALGGEARLAVRQAIRARSSALDRCVWRQEEFGRAEALIEEIDAAGPEEEIAC